MFTISDILDIAVQIEENGEAYYRRAIRSTTDPKLVEMFAWLAEQEAAHARWFADMRGRIDTVVEDPQVAGIGRALLRDAVSEQGFALAEAQAQDLARVRSLIELSIAFEEDTAAFYELLRSFVTEDEDRAHLDEIIDQERSHVEQLRSVLADESVKMS